MIRVHVAAEKSISSAMEDKNVGKKTGITVDIMAGYEEVLWGRNRDEKYFVKS